MAKAEGTLGIIRVLSTKYAQIKQSIQEHPKRISLNDSGSMLNDKGNMRYIIHTLHFRLIPKKEGKIEMSNWHLPPKYVEKFDNSNDILKELTIKFTRLQEDQQKRIMPKFDDEENPKIDRQIRDNITEMTKKIKECEDNIRFIATDHSDTPQEKSIKENMKQNIVAKLQDFTKKLKLNEEEYMKKYQELVGDDTKYPSHSLLDSKANMADESIKSNNFLKLEATNRNDRLKKRDTELGNLLVSINELAQIFKDLQTLVMEQGTILDRIDYNIESALVSTKDAHKELVKADDHMKSNCARNANLILIVVIFICSLLLLCKLF